jgi:hypothetical protein
MPNPKLSPAQFAEKIKSKYPQYASIDDVTLVDRVLQKYPQYGDIVNVNDAGEEVKKKEFSEVSVLRPTEEPSASDTSFDAETEVKRTVGDPIQKFKDIGALVGGSIAEGVVSANTFLNRAVEGIFLGSNTNYFSSNSAKLLEPLRENKNNLKAAYVGPKSANKGIVEAFQEDPAEGAKLLAFEAAYQLPQMLALGAIGRTAMAAEGAAAAGLRTGAILSPRTKLAKIIAEEAAPMVPLGMSAAGQAYLDASEKNPEEDWIDVITNLAVGTYKGTGEIASELLFRTSVDDLIRGGLKKGLVSDIAKSTRPALQAAKQVGKDVVTEGFQEGIEELAVEISSNSLDALLYGEDMLSKKNIYGMADAFILGSALGSPITLLSKGPSAIGTAKDINKRRKISEEVNDLYDVHQDPTTTASEKAVVKGQIINKLAELKQVENNLASFYEEFSEEDRDNVISLNQQLSMAQLIYPELQNEQSKEALQEEVKKLYSDKTKIEVKYDPNIKVYEYDTQKEAGIPSTVVEGQAPIEVQPIQVASGTSTEADRVLQVLEQQEVFQKIAEAQEVDNTEAQAAQQQILNAIDEVDALDIADDVKTAYIQTLEDKFDDIEYYDNKTITTTEQVTEEVPIGAPRAGSRTIVEPEVRRGKFRLFERLNNLEVAVGTETEGQTSVIETQEDGSIDVVTYDKATKQEVSRQPKVAENILGLEYVESILDADGNLTGVVMRPKTPKGEDISPVRIQVVNRPELALDIAIDARKKEIGDVPEVIWMQEYETVTRDVTTKERVPAAKRPERKAARVVLPTETVVAEQVTEQVVEQEPVKNNEGLSSEQVTEAVSAAERLARRLGLPTKIVVHNSRKEFNDAMDEVSKSGSVASGVESGRFIPSRNEIHLNLEDMTSEVPFHEVFHAAFVNRFAKASQATREKIASDFQSGLLRVLRSGTAEDQQLADAVERFVQGGEYSAKESSEEFMAQTAGFIATSGKKISKTTMDKLIQWLNNFIGKISPSLKVTTRGEFIDFMNSFSGALFESGTDSRDVSEVVSEINEASSKQSDPKAISAALAIVNNVNNKYPEAVEQQVVSAEFKEDKFGKKGTLYDVKSIPYKLSDGAKKYFGENAVEKLSDKIVSDVKKYQGNKDISKGIGWYSNFRTQFQRKFGASLELFGQLLAATSAQTPVDINFRQAIDALRQYSKGSYDNLIKDYSKYVDSIEKMSRQDIIDSIEVRTKKKKTNYTDLDIINEKRKLINEFKDAPLQSNGKKFNANSAKVLQAIYGNWLSQTQGPKTKNFAGNLTGRSYEATIDVWAARYLRRIIYKDNISRWRIHPKQEGAVEHTVSVDGVTGGDYFFAEEVMRKAAEKLNWNADDLQAFLWFLEKDIWSKNNWTGAAGRKKSSFEEEAEKLLTERYQAGVTTFKDFDTFNKEEFEAAKVELLNTIRAVDGLIVGRVVESEGEYYSPSGDVYAEPTFDVEFSVDEGTDVSSIEAKVIEIGKRYNQEAVLFSKITEKKGKNSAPIIEIGLKNPSKNSKTIESIKKMLSGLGVRGFTVSRDSRGNILGVRTQYIKEFEGQPISFGEILFSSAEKELRNQFEKNNDISYISSNFVETNVTFTENEKATEIPSDAKAKDDAAITGGLESSSRVAGEPSGPSRAGATGGITESSSRDVREEILDKEQLSFKQRAVNTAKSFVWSDTQKQIRVFKERMSSQLSVEGREIKKFTKGLNQLLKKADVQTIDLVGNIFDGTLTPENQRILESKPNGSLIFGQANAMRNYIDSFADDFVNSPEFHALPEETVNTIIDNFGQYMRGSYRFWKDKNFKPSNAARRDAIAYEYEILRSKKINDLIDKEGFKEDEAGEFFELLHDETLKEATKAIDDYIADIEKIRNGSDFKKLGIISPSGIKLPSEQFLRRKELPETIQNLLGKERDPIIRFIDTTIALSNIKYKGHMLYAISESLGGTQFIKNEVTDAEKSTGEYKEVKDKFSPLNGRFVHRDVYEAITNQNIYESDNIWMSGYLTTLQLARKSKVIYNLPTWRKNLTGGWYTMAANGVINASIVKDLKRRAQLFANGETDAETEALIKIMGDNGIIGQDVNANLLGFTNAIYSRTLTGNDNDYISYVDRARNLIKNFDSVVGQKYAAVDDYTKLVIFRSEIQSFAKKIYGKSYNSLTEAQKNKVHAEAAEFVKQNTPTFSRLPKWYASLAKLPAGDFLSFEFESLRSFGTNILNGQRDLMRGMTDKTLSKEQKAEYIESGSRRLAGSAAILGARLAITSILASLALGDDDELEEDIKNNRPNWMEGHSIIPTKVSKEGIATVYDYSMEDPYGSFFDLATDPLSFPAYIVDLLQPNMGISFLTNLAENKDFYGRDITNSYDDPLTKGYKYGGHTLKSLIIPPFIASSYRDEQKRLEAEADKYSPLDAVGRVASRAVIRDYEYNIPVQFYYFTDQFRTKKEQYSDLTGASRDNRLAELDEIKKMYKSITNIGIKKGNYKIIADANKNIKRALKPAEEAYVLYGYEIPEKK